MAINPNTMMPDIRGKLMAGLYPAESRQVGAYIPVKSTYVVHVLDIEAGYGVSIQADNSVDHRVLLAASAEDMVKKMLTYIVEKNLET